MRGSLNSHLNVKRQLLAKARLNQQVDKAEEQEKEEETTSSSFSIAKAYDAFMGRPAATRDTIETTITTIEEDKSTTKNDERILQLDDVIIETEKKTKEGNSDLIGTSLFKDLKSTQMKGRLMELINYLQYYTSSELDSKTPEYVGELFSSIVLLLLAKKEDKDILEATDEFIRKVTKSVEKTDARNLLSNILKSGDYRADAKLLKEEDDFSSQYNPKILKYTVTQFLSHPSIKCLLDDIKILMHLTLLDNSEFYRYLHLVIGAAYNINTSLLCTVDLFTVYLLFITNEINFELEKHDGAVVQRFIFPLLLDRDNINSPFAKDCKYFWSKTADTNKVFLSLRQKYQPQAQSTENEEQTVEIYRENPFNSVKQSIIANRCIDYVVFRLNFFNVFNAKADHTLIKYLIERTYMETYYNQFTSHTFEQSFKVFGTALFRHAHQKAFEKLKNFIIYQGEKALKHDITFEDIVKKCKEKNVDLYSIISVLTAAEIRQMEFYKKSGTKSEDAQIKENMKTAEDYVASKIYLII